MTSIYRLHRLGLRNENDVRSLAHPSTSASNLPPDRLRDWTLHRKAQAANVVLPTTRRWANELPRGLEPQALLRQYPRIANRIANAWKDGVDARLIFDDLLVERRPARKGFPPDVLHDLLRLRAHCLGQDLPNPALRLRHWSARLMNRD